MRRLTAFLASLDARAWRSIAASFALFGGVGVVFLVGAKLLGPSGAGLARHWLGSVHGAWAGPATIGAFAVLAFLGLPQFVLIAAAVAAFGPWPGMLYSWEGTMVSALVGFWLGRSFGAGALKGLNSEGVARFTALVGRNGFLASLLIRLVPFAPFVVVNMAAGAASVRPRDFTAGTALGIVPKIALTALAGGSLILAARGQALWPLVWLGAAALAWIAVGLAARAWLKRRERETGAQ